MNVVRRRKLFFVLFIVVGVSLAVFLAIKALNENLNFYYNPSQIVSGDAPLNTAIRGGGLVIKNSLIRASDNLSVEFKITDMHSVIPVRYSGILPDLFREGQGVVVLGKVKKDGIFYASQVLAKHDANYMPPEVKSKVHS